MTDSISTARTGKGDMIWGILMLICGFLAITLPLASGIGVAIVIGWVLLISGVWHLLFGFRSGSGIGGFFLELFLSLLFCAGGVLGPFFSPPPLPRGPPACATVVLLPAALP